MAGSKADSEKRVKRLSNIKQGEYLQAAWIFLYFYSMETQELCIDV